MLLFFSASTLAPQTSSEKLCKIYPNFFYVKGIIKQLTLLFLISYGVLHILMEYIYWLTQVVQDHLVEIIY